jgi:hypothetical protein
MLRLTFFIGAAASTTPLHHRIAELADYLIENA